MMPGINHAAVADKAVSNMSVVSGVLTDTMQHIQHTIPPTIIGINCLKPPVIKVGMPYNNKNNEEEDCS